ncbi:MAG TPA: SDR family oxidoreductase [Myxococcales bacterium]|nr:SDR family oxidoreductase [Myxococcales bacterium]
MSIEQKVVAITGGSSGLGEAAARLLAARGARVFLGARRKERLDAIAAELGEERAAAFALDVTRRAQVEAFVQAAVERFGRLDVMVNNAGLMALAPFGKARVDEWDRMIDVNLKGVLYGIAAALPVFERQKGGHFVNISSVAGLKVRAGNGVYAATKHAVRAISEGLRQEVEGIRVTIISPGVVQSELPGGTQDPDTAPRVREMYAQTAIPAEAVARAIAFAIDQPPEVDVNEIVLRPTVQEF